MHPTRADASPAPASFFSLSQLEGEVAMQIQPDRSKCHGHARCAAVAADVFLLDEEGYIQDRLIEVPPGREDAARRGVLSCPERTLSVVGEPTIDN